VEANPAVVAIQGPAYEARAYGGATARQLVTPWVFLLGLMSLLLVTRHTHQEEETGRAELVSAGVVGRHAWLAAALLYVLAVNAVLAVITALALIAKGLPAAGSIPTGRRLRPGRAGVRRRGGDHRPADPVRAARQRDGLRRAGRGLPPPGHRLSLGA
jgi:ABC-2 type transport system permease protein